MKMLKILDTIDGLLNNRIKPVLSRNLEIINRSFPEDCLGEGRKPSGDTHCRK